MGIGRTRVESRGDQLVIERGEEGRWEGKGGGMETGTGRAGALGSIGEWRS